MAGAIAASALEGETVVRNWRGDQLVPEFTQDLATLTGRSRLMPARIIAIDGRGLGKSTVSRCRRGARASDPRHRLCRAVTLARWSRVDLDNGDAVAEVPVPP
jgi:hypothetical protein